MSVENPNASLSSINDPDYDLLLPRWGYELASFALVLIGFFGFFLNLLTMVLIIKDPKLWTPLNMILFNLIFSDFSVSVFGNPITLIASLFHRWVFGQTMCMIYGFFMALLVPGGSTIPGTGNSHGNGGAGGAKNSRRPGYSRPLYLVTFNARTLRTDEKLLELEEAMSINAITTLTVLSFERYEMVANSLTTRRLNTRRAGFTIAGIWCYALAVTTPPLFGWSSFVNEGANISCSVNWKEQTTNALTYIIYLFVMGQVVPAVIICYSYLSIVIIIKKNAARLGRNNKAESRVTWMVFVMILAFMIAWFPYSMIALTEQFAPHIEIPPALAVIPALLAKSSICYNPLIYIGMNTQFQSTLKRTTGLFTNNEESTQRQRFTHTEISLTRAISNNDSNNTKLLHADSTNFSRSCNDPKIEPEEKQSRTDFKGYSNIILEAENETLLENIPKKSSSNYETDNKVTEISSYNESITRRDTRGTHDNVSNHKSNSLECDHFDDRNSGTESIKNKYVNKTELRQCHLNLYKSCNYTNSKLLDNGDDQKYADTLSQISMKEVNYTDKHLYKNPLTFTKKYAKNSLSSPLLFSEIRRSSSSDIDEVKNDRRSRVFSFDGVNVSVPSGPETPKNLVRSVEDQISTDS